MKVTSIVWELFGYRRSDAQETMVKCKKLKKTVTAKRGNSTNYFNHLKQKHPLLYEERSRAKVISKPKKNLTVF